METPQDEQVVEPVDASDSPTWTRTREEPDADQSDEWTTPADDAHSLDEPGYGHGV